MIGPLFSFPSNELFLSLIFGSSLVKFAVTIGISITKNISIINKELDIFFIFSTPYKNTLLSNSQL